MENCIARAEHEEFAILAAKKNIGLGYHLEMYSSW